MQAAMGWGVEKAEFMIISLYLIKDNGNRFARINGLKFWLTITGLGWVNDYLKLLKELVLTIDDQRMLLIDVNSVKYLQTTGTLPVNVQCTLSLYRNVQF